MYISGVAYVIGCFNQTVKSALYIIDMMLYTYIRISSREVPSKGVSPAEFCSPRSAPTESRYSTPSMELAEAASWRAVVRVSELWEEGGGGRGEGRGGEGREGRRMGLTQT